MRRLVLVLVAVALTAPLIVALQPLLETQAEHEDARVLTDQDKDPGPGDPRVLLRNLIKGQPIPVCSADYPNATKEAMRRWNEALGITAFQWKSDVVDQCGTTLDEDVDAKDRPQDGIGSIVVVGEADPCGFEARWGVVAYGCAHWYHRYPAAGGELHATYDNVWNTFYGKLYLGLNNTKGSNKYPEDIGGNAVVGGACQLPSGPGGAEQQAYCEDLLWTLAHEFGHALTLAHFDDLMDEDDGKAGDTCTNDGLPAPGRDAIKALMTSPAGSPCEPDVGVPQAADLEAYEDAYYPGPATGVTATRNDDDDGVTLTWARLYGADNAGIHADYAVHYLARPAPTEADLETCWYVVGVDLAPYGGAPC